jgi:hypothetical protein
MVATQPEMRLQQVMVLGIIERDMFLYVEE